jgi:alpha,alpha-trehalase
MLLFETSTVQFKSPDEIYGDLFFHVQLSGIFGDYKTFPDCIPKIPIEEILDRYHAQKYQPNFDLKNFVYENFQLPYVDNSEYIADTTVTIHRHIDNLWDVLSRKVTDQALNSSLVNLPYPYIIPGGRFREIFYWDSYFIMLGLKESGRHELVRSMVDNFSFLIHTFGYIPNGNRTYFMGRTQPPFYSSMIELLSEKDPAAIIKYLPYMEKEYRFWMTGAERLSSYQNNYKRLVRMPDGEFLNRYWDDKTTPRPEAYGKEILLSNNMEPSVAGEMYRNMRAACESGWDFSSRWLRTNNSLKSFYTTEIIPVDLNCLLYHLEDSISKAYYMKGLPLQGEHYSSFASQRKNAILKYCWSEEDNFFMDYDFVQNKHTPCYSLAGCFPLFFHICTSHQAKGVTEKLRNSFLKDGGFVTTLSGSPFQWDSPNGWAPLQWITIKGLLNYDERELAMKGAYRWMELNNKIYRTTGKLIEKYNVVDLSMRTGGGEYPLQDGFGWTNGVYLKLQSIL